MGCISRVNRRQFLYSALPLISLARSAGGVRFTNAHSPSATCTPSRYAPRAGYATGAIGKWHLGLGRGNLDWNRDIAPGPLDVAFDYPFILPATGSRPTTRRFSM